MTMEDDAEEEVVIWEKRAVLMSAFGIVGFGALVGVLTVSFRYFKRRLETKLTIKPLKSLFSSEPRESQGDDGPLSGRSTFSSASLPLPKQSFHSLRLAASHKQQAAVEEPNSIQNSELIRTTGVVGSSGEPEDELTTFFAIIDLLLDGAQTEQHEAYVKLKSNTEKLEDVCDFWWRMSRATHIQAQIAEQRGDKDSQKSLLINAVTYGEKALKLNDSSADAHKWFAITSGNRGDFLKVKERIQSGYVFKEHVDRAVELNPADAFLHHLLGRFCYEVAQLTWVERRLAATLFSDPPTATVPEALGHFLECEKRGKPTLENSLYIGKCYISLGDNKKAAVQLQVASKIPPATGTDKQALAAVMELLGKYKKYL